MSSTHDAGAPAADINARPTDTAEILFTVRNHVAVITLNRPAALNALSVGMFVELRQVLQRCAEDTEVRVVVLRGAGDKAFCAGGDIRSLYQSFKESSSPPLEFFALEYSLDYALHSYPKPYVALMDGITMGGGMGLAQGSAFRIVGERTRLAMPEVGIGLFPDVGSSYFLSRLPGSLGIYLGLTGAQFGGADAVYARLADVFIAPAAMASFTDDLAELAWSDDWNADVQAFVRSRAVQHSAVTPLGARRAAIDLHFSKLTAADILASLDAEPREEHAAWARDTAALLRSRSPTMVSVALRQLHTGAGLALADCFRMEFGMAQQCFEQGDFIEGVRALLIDKDKAPRWKPEKLADVTEASVAAFFRERWRAAEHPLAALESLSFHT